MRAIVVHKTRARSGSNWHSNASTKAMMVACFTAHPKVRLLRSVKVVARSVTAQSMARHVHARTVG
jgi:hypothetical protein